ncbi:MAG: glycosyltransferase family 2 protein [Bacteroidales bacterium]|nr:glycosyltransferase family 2 protein [Bacteroidales bacterium]
MDISIVVPLFNEEESLPELSQWIARVMSLNKFSYQLILVDDGSTDSSWSVVEKLAETTSSIEAIKFRRNYGKAAALQVGFNAAKGDVVITMDADLQDSPEEIPALYNMVMKEGYDLVSGWKKKRHDPISKRWPSKIYNRLVRMVTGIKLHDFNCGLKAYSLATVKGIEVYGDMHRYIPVIAKASGFKRIGEKVVQHQARKFGVSKFGVGRARGMFDLLTISFMSKFGKKPMHLFGTLGFLMTFIGFVAAAYLGALKLYSVAQNIPSKLVTDSPYFYIALACMIIGTQLFLAGFLGEMLSRNSIDSNNYLIEKETKKNV